MSLALKRTAEKLADDSVGEERMGGTTEKQEPENRILTTSRQKGGGARTPMLGYSLNSVGR